MSLFSQRLWQSSVSVRPSATLQSSSAAAAAFSHSFLCRKFEGEIVGKENWPTKLREEREECGESGRRTAGGGRREKQQRRQQMGTGGGGGGWDSRAMTYPSLWAAESDPFKLSPSV